MVSRLASWEHWVIAEPLASPPPLPPPSPPPNWSRPPSRPPVGIARSRDDKVLGGVAAGIAKRLGIDALIVRIAFVVLTVAGGSGVLLYVIGWLWLPKEGTTDTIVHQVSRRDFGQTFAVALLVLGGLLLLRAMGFWFDDRIVWPVVLASAGLAVIWRQADDEDREPLTRVAARLPLPGHSPPFRVRTGRASPLRVGIGVSLFAGGARPFLATKGAFEAVRQGFAATAGIVGGFALVFGPWWWRLGKELSSERRERIRSQERAEMATHLPDSVLQTLALIQLRAEDPRAVAGLARRQERELRAWLFGGRPHAEGDSFNA